MVTFEWSWFSFFMGALALFTLIFWVMVIGIIRQQLKQKRDATAFENLVKDWNKNGTGYSSPE